MLLWFVSDIHEDANALKKWLSLLKEKNCDKLICLWDLVDLSDETGCIELVQKNCDISVIGNHDICAIKRIPESAGIFKYPDNWYQLSIPEQIKMADNRIRMIESDEDLNNLKVSDNTKDFLSSLPEWTIFESDNANILLSHRVYPNLSWCWKTPDEQRIRNDISDYFQHFDFMENHNCKVSFVWHEHDRNLVYTRNGSFDIEFDKPYTIWDIPCCFSVPAIWYCHSTMQQWVAIFDTEKMEVTYLKI